ncbi:homogentisate 1,2-dioxygenase [Polymorphobacter fuscus]|uniref:Homogentisate 1,2-dioxygenase n=1 Tax=Sandarakinorhabdus fusca TaxID=1439888 RepID=A0A7C9GNY8_9SPHN|nr:homogentisate 1,2-dioxygenase [Polymorphobacter fuscus]KAB7647391.1 homogentisate 1,2-dioxygenase [Polymorphobacter fuscus]MQT16633.1 homogentisate 1,2-dioxygenase [Polymorphobacter fuscus]NJC09384.1 homogentisate 1,2-dioxygenase [Polymorphobacter fuscus]
MLTGFGNHFSTEAVPGALPIGRNSPQRPPFGLYAEQLSGTAFTMARAENRRAWLYRLRPSALHGAFTPLPEPVGHSARPPGPNRLRWDPRPLPETPTTFLASIVPMLSNGDPAALTGVSLATYAATRDMGNQAYFSADGEILVIPRQGRLRIDTEMGQMAVEPLEIALIPRGLRFRVILPDGSASGYLAENHGAPFRLPDLGPIGSNGLANPRDFASPAAWFEDRDEPFELVQKFGGRLWTTTLAHSPFDVVAWHGNLAPVKYDLRRFNTIGTVSHDHPDPSIFTVLTSPSDMPGRANADFVIFPPRWMVAEDTFRPPWFHRNIMSEAMGLITGAYDAKAGGFAPGGLSLHNMMNAHGPDAASWRAATDAVLAPHKIDGTMAFMLESCWPYRVTDGAMALAQPDYDAAWSGFPKAVV